MHIMNKFIHISCVAVLAILLPALAAAQPSMPQSPGIPIDGGISLLIAGGAAYGAKKLRDRQRPEEGNQE